MRRLLNSNRIVALMSGTSVDSIDAALCEVGESSTGRLGAELISFYEHAIDEGLRQRIFQAFDDGPNSLSLACSLNFEIGVAFADAALELIRKSGVKPSSISAIASHGQTLYHIAPHMVSPGTSAVASTLQIGEAAVIAERTGIRVVADFRVADMAAGGNGAPLVPFADFQLFSNPGHGIVVHNVGGIANCTYLSASGMIEDVLAFDTGPGNMIIDGLVQHFYKGETFDRDGSHAARGTIREDILAEWMRIPYISAAPPKSTGRELFGLQFAETAIRQNPDAAPDDLIATATLFTARSFAENVRDHLLPMGEVHEVLVAGGGALNRHLFSLFEIETRRVCPTASIRRLDEAGVPSKARECIAFALLGYARLHNIAANVPSATGARHPALLGKISDPPPR